MPNTIFITGASSGIGKATALFFAEKGWNVIATMRSPEKEKELCSKEKIRCLRLDVTDVDSIEQAIQSGMEAFHGIDVLVNNAGYGLVGPFEGLEEKDIQKQFATNVFGLMAVTRAILPYFRERRSGTIINISSIGGRLTFPLYSIYHATKWAVEGFSESLQFELRPFGIYVKLVEPGPVKTDFYDRSLAFVQNGKTKSYNGVIEKAMPRMQQSGVTGASPKTIAKTIYRAATDGKFKLRYPGDPYARAILWTRRSMPDWLFHRLMHRYLIDR